MNKITFLVILLWGTIALNLQSADMLSEKNVDQVQVGEVLQMLDMILAELPVFIEKYELNSGLSWQEWKKKYWLLAPAGGLILGLKIYFVLASIFSATSRETSPVAQNTWE